MDMMKAVQDAVGRFKGEINAIALNAAAEALGTLGEIPHVATPRTRNAKSVAPVKAGRRAPGEKRDPAAIEAIGTKFLAYVTEHHGQNIEGISKALNIPTNELSVPVKKLIAAGDVKTFGERRATRYFPKGVRPTKALVEDIKAAAAPAAAE